MVTIAALALLATLPRDARTSNPRQRTTIYLCAPLGPVLSHGKRVGWGAGGTCDGRHDDTAAMTYAFDLAERAELVVYLCCHAFFIGHPCGWPSRAMMAACEAIER